MKCFKFRLHCFCVQCVVIHSWGFILRSPLWPPRHFYCSPAVNVTLVPVLPRRWVLVMRLFNTTLSRTVRGCIRIQLSSWWFSDNLHTPPLLEFIWIQWVQNHLVFVVVLPPWKKTYSLINNCLLSSVYYFVHSVLLEMNDTFLTMGNKTPKTFSLSL